MLPPDPAVVASGVRPGRIILLNGASSSGKSSIGQALLALLPDPWFLVPVDSISGMRSTVHTSALDETEVADMLRRTRLGYHRAVEALASTGNDVVMDYPLSEPWRLEDLVDVLAGFDVTLVEVRCDRAELGRRERARDDRPTGLAQSQEVGTGVADIVVDSTVASAEECAKAIVDALPGVSEPKAFALLRARSTPT